MKILYNFSVKGCVSFFLFAVTALMDFAKQALQRFELYELCSFVLIEIFEVLIIYFQMTKNLKII